MPSDTRAFGRAAPLILLALHGLRCGDASSPGDHATETADIELQPSPVRAEVPAQTDVATEAGHLARTPADGAGQPSTLLVDLGGTVAPSGLAEAPAAGCSAPRSWCDKDCVDTRSHPLHCGRCGDICPWGSRGAATCSAGACGLRCDAQFGDCDGLLGSGCETDLRTAVAHCGACGHACGASRSCRGGVCA